MYCINKGIPNFYHIELFIHYIQKFFFLFL